MKSPAWTTFGGLGPDVTRDELVQKKNGRSKVQEYSKLLREANRSSTHRQARAQEKSVPELSDVREAVIVGELHSASPVSTRVNRQSYHPAVLRELLVEYESLQLVVDAIRGRYLSNSNSCFLPCAYLHVLPSYRCS